MAKKQLKRSKYRTPIFIEIGCFAFLALILISFLQLGSVGNFLDKGFFILFEDYRFFVYLGAIAFIITTMFKKDFYPFFSKFTLIFFNFNFLSFLFFGIINKQSLGLVGSPVFSLFNYLFSDGLIIIVIVMLLITLVILFNFSIVDYIQMKFSKKEVPIGEDEIRVSKKNRKMKKLNLKTNKNTYLTDITDLKLASKNDVIIPSKKEILKDEVIEIKQENIKPKVNMLDLTNPIVEEVKLEERKPNSKYQLPSLEILKDHKVENKVSEEEVYIKSEKLVQVLKDFNINVKVVQINIGPAVSQFELEIAAGTKIAKIESLSKEISLALAAKGVRIQAPIPGKSFVGIEIPNSHTTLVPLKTVVKPYYSKQNNNIWFGLGRNINGKPFIAEVNKMPHLLVAGSTGSGKSVCINSIIISILLTKKPDEVRFIMIDPKKVELNNYNGIPHLMAPVVNEPKKAAIVLNRVVAEMESRYDRFAETNTRNIETYNEFQKKNNENLVLPYIVVIIDELADLMMVASKDVEDAIMRITQMARAAGIHLIVATQRPSTDVITGVIKANIPARIAFSVASGIDSRTILDAMGAEKLQGKGDMLYLAPGAQKAERIQGAYLTDEEINDVVFQTIKEQQAQFDEKFTNIEVNQNPNVELDEDDPLLDEVITFVKESQKASTSLVQRRFRIGYNRAARLIDLLEAKGIVGPSNGSKPREVYEEE